MAARVFSITVSGYAVYARILSMRAVRPSLTSAARSVATQPSFGRHGRQNQCPLLRAQRTQVGHGVMSELCQQATSHVWLRMKEAANLGRPRLIDSSSLTVLNSKLPLLS